MATLRGTAQDYAPTMQRSGNDGVLGVNSGLLRESLIKNSNSSNAALAGPLVWSGADYQGDQAYTLRLSGEEAKEVDSALASFKS
jgi:hypothetical protein